MSKICAVEGCGREVRGRGYCEMHYMRLHRHGSVDAGRPDWYGTKSSHPMYITWVAAKREKKLCDAWRDDFWKFLDDISPIPEGSWRLRRVDASLPYSKENIFWKQVVISRAKSESESSYQKRRREAKLYVESPENRRKYNLRSNHGMSVEQYEQMLADQNGLCAICGKAETKPSTGGSDKPLPLAVDDCHKTRQSGKSKGIRGLLCQACNIGLGKFDDDPEMLRKAAAYLEKYRQ